MEKRDHSGFETKVVGVGDGQWSMVDGLWSMVDGRWSMVDGLWT